ncbi:GFA family protein [Roseomonas sp. CAU 1739]|uniref:GFA family protein n=1 Tax=Roseomonas sp. CAU 1739 TaxID=3140364 RepID=UPI00325BE560
MTFPREGGCQCGAIRYAVARPPTVIFACHCTACQRRSGSAFVVSLIVPDRDFRLTRGRLKPQTRTADSGATLTHWFCADCGTAILGMERGTAPQLYQTVRVGTLDDSTGLRPAVHVWTRSAQDWVAIPQGSHAFPENPPRPLLNYGQAPAS